MPSASLLTLAVLVWSFGAAGYTWQLWKARGATDNGFPGLLGMIAGSVLMCCALAELPRLALCALIPAGFAIAIGYTKAACVARARWHRTPNELPTMLPREPEPYDGLPGRPWDGHWIDDPALDPFSPDVRQRLKEQHLFITVPATETAVDEAIAKAEAERAQRIGKMFGG
jgi:hypothetical protein